MDNIVKKNRKPITFNRAEYVQRGSVDMNQDLHIFLTLNFYSLAMVSSYSSFHHDLYTLVGISRVT